MISVGETLRRERLRRGLHLEEVARETKIRQKLLEHIESDQFEYLPGGVFARNFVKQYATILGLDGDELAEEVTRQIEPAPADLTHAPALRPVNTPPAVSWSGMGKSRSSSAWTAFALLAAVLIGSSLVYQWWQSRTQPRISASAGHREPSANMPESATPKPIAAPDQPVGGETDAGQPRPGRPEEEASVQPRPGAPVQVVLSATEETWVRVTSDGTHVFSGTLTPEETRTVEGTENIRLRVGNAGGLSVTLNGRPVGPIGPRGQIRELELTPGGADIRLPTPTAPVVAPPDIL